MEFLGEYPVMIEVGEVRVEATPLNNIRLISYSLVSEKPIQVFDFRSRVFSLDEILNNRMKIDGPARIILACDRSSNATFLIVLDSVVENPEIVLTTRPVRGRLIKSLGGGSVNLIDIGGE